LLHVPVYNIFEASYSVLNASFCAAIITLTVSFIIIIIIIIIIFIIIIIITHRRGSEEGKWRMQWVASTLHTTSEHGVSSISTADAHTSAASSRLN
jgi:hypothetical protein